MFKKAMKLIAVSLESLWYTLIFIYTLRPHYFVSPLLHINVIPLLILLVETAMAKPLAAPIAAQARRAHSAKFYNAI